MVLVYLLVEMSVEMNYKDARAYIHEIEGRLGSDYSLDSVRKLCDKVFRPDRFLKIIHIAGTNGKGSVGSFISNILAMAGYRVGRYVSPALFSYRERIQYITKGMDETIDTEYISREAVAKWMTVLKEKCEEIEKEGFSYPTAFEIETILSFLAFREQDIDIVVLETGLGGRLDATNIIEHPLFCVFTSISLEHQGFLGGTIEQIASEKYGILKTGTNVVSFRQEECNTILEERCQEKGAHLYYVDKESLIPEMLSIDKNTFHYRGERYESGLRGIHQIENAALAIEVCRQMTEQFGYRIDIEAIRQGIKTVKWKGRFDLLSKDPVVIADGAHNPDAIKRLLESFSTYYPAEKFNLVMGVFKDKDYEEEVKLLMPYVYRVYTVNAAGVRSLDSGTLTDCFRREGERRGIPIIVQEYRRISEACDTCLCDIAAEKKARKMVICGSLSIMKEVYRYFGQEIL